MLLRTSFALYKLLVSSVFQQQLPHKQPKNDNATCTTSIVTATAINTATNESASKKSIRKR